MSCELDTDGDGDCQFCYRLGNGCFKNKPNVLELTPERCSCGFNVLLACHTAGAYWYECPNCGTKSEGRFDQRDSLAHFRALRYHARRKADSIRKLDDRRGSSAGSSADRSEYQR